MTINKRTTALFALMLALVVGIGMPLGYIHVAGAALPTTSSSSSSSTSTLTQACGSPNPCSYGNGLCPSGETCTSFPVSPSECSNGRGFTCTSTTSTGSSSSTSSSTTTTTIIGTITATLTPTSPVYDTGQTITLTATWSGGVPPYTGNFVIYVGPYPAIGKQTFTQTGTTKVFSISSSKLPPAVYTAALEVCTGLSGICPIPFPLTFASATDSITINPALTNPVVPSEGADKGQGVILTATWSGGTPPYTVTWYSGGSATSCSADNHVIATHSVGTQTTDTEDVNPNSNTYYCVAVTDSATTPVTVKSQPALVTLNPQLVAGAITGTPTPPIPFGTSIQLQSNPSGGTTPYTYQWYSGSGTACQLSSPISGATGAVYVATPSVTTVYCYTVRDAASETATSPAYSVAVTNNLQCGLLPLNLAQLLQSTAPWYCPINNQIYQVWKNDLPFVFIVVLLTLTVAGLIFMVGIAFKSDRIRNFGIGEFYEGLASAIIVAFFLYICAVVFGIGPAIAVGGINPYATSLNLISSTIGQAQGLYGAMYQTYLSYKYYLSINFVITLSDACGGESSIISKGMCSSLSSGQSYFSQAKAIYTLPIQLYYLEPAATISALLIDGMAALYSQYYLIVFFSIASIPAFLVPGVVFRALLPTRALGGILIATAIAFYLVMPTMFAIAYYFTSPSLLANLAASQAQLTRWGTGTGALQNSLSPSSPLPGALADVQSAMSSFWLLVLFYPALIIAVTYAFITQVANFIGSAPRVGGKMRGFV